MEGNKVAVFVSRDPRLLEELVDEVDLFVSDRSDLEDMVPDSKLFYLKLSEDKILQLLESKGVSTSVC